MTLTRNQQITMRGYLLIEATRRYSKLDRQELKSLSKKLKNNTQNYSLEDVYNMIELCKIYCDCNTDKILEVLEGNL